MIKLKKTGIISLSLAIFISACSNSIQSTLPIEQTNNSQTVNAEFSAFASQTVNQLLVEEDENKDDIITQVESGLESKEMLELDLDKNGGLTKDELTNALQSEYFNAVKVSESLASESQVGSTPVYQGPLPNRLKPSTFKNNNVQLYLDKEEILPMIFETLRSAKETIQLDLFLLGGNIGMQVAQELAQKSQEGVDIKITFDPNLGFAGPTQKEVYQVISFLQQNNINFKLYPLHLIPLVTDGALKNKFQIDHNKMIVVDSSTFVIGGFNLFDIGVVNRDLMLKIEGPTAQEASEMLLYEWSISDNFVAPKAPKNLYVVKADQGGSSSVRIVRTGIFERSVKTAIVDMVNKAQKNVYLSVLEISDMDLTKALINAHKRGVDVRVIMDRKDTNDKYAGGLPIPNGFPNILPAMHLFQNRVPVRWYDAKFKGQELHMKMVVADGNHLITGSTNFTRQAFTTFRETSAEVMGGTAPGKMERGFMDDWLNHSTSIKKITLKDKLKAKVIEFLDKKYYSWW